MDIVGKTIQNGEPTPEHPVEIENKTNILLAIEILKKLKTAKHHIQVDKPDGGEEIFELPYLSSIEQQAIDAVLSELEKKDKEYEELTEASKELCKTVNLMKKVINEMAKHIHLSGDYECLNKECEDDGSKDCEECIKEYFEKKEGENNDKKSR